MKKNKPKKLARLLLKAIWLGLASILVLIAGTVLFLCAWALDEPKSFGDMIALTIVASVLLLALLAIYVRVFRKSKRTLLRWTKKSFVVLMPLVVIAMIIAVASFSHLDKTSQFGAVEGLAGQQGYTEGLSFAPDKLLTLTNDERIKNGKAPLALNTKLNDSALLKCGDMVKNDYWSHNDKNGAEPWRFIDQTGYGHGRVGENQAYGFTSENAVTTGWMNSEGHRNNLLDESFSEVGFGVCVSDNFVNQGKQLIVVQHFGQPKPIGNSNGSTTNGTAQAQNTKHYSSGECSQTPTPYKTRYENNPYLPQGQQKVRQEGVNGYTTSCTPDSNGKVIQGYSYPGYDKIIEVGTYVAPNSTSNPPVKNYSQCNQYAGTGAYQACIDAINAQ